MSILDGVEMKEKSSFL